MRDGRYEEQKVRLKNSGISNVIYLIEGRQPSQYCNIPLEALKKAMLHTQVYLSFNIIRMETHS